MKDRSEKQLTTAWREYQSGIEYNRSIGFYNTVQTNERFYRGDQWSNITTDLVNKPVFNIIDRVTSHLVSSVVAQQISIQYSADALPVMEDTEYAEGLPDVIETMKRHAAYRWEQSKMDALFRDSLIDAALSGNGVFYTYWDPEIKTGTDYKGDFVTEIIDSSRLYVSDVNNDDIQKQRYIIISGRMEVARLKEEAKRNGVPKEEIARICADTDTQTQPSVIGQTENPDSGAGKATYIIKFYHNDEGYVCWQKSTETVVIREEETRLRLYPVAMYAWKKTKGSYRGTSPITPIIENQKYINKAYALAMKHMIDTAFSKVVYDKSLISEWSNEVGQAIGVRGSVDVRNAVATVGVGQMQPNYLNVIAGVESETKEVLGATDAALGEVKPENTSAILALQEASSVPLELVRQNAYQGIEDLANVWADFMTAYYTDGRMTVFVGAGGLTAYPVDFSKYADALIHARVDVGASTKYTEAAALRTLNNLLYGGFIDTITYLKYMPSNVLPVKDNIIADLQAAQEAQAAAQQAQTQAQGIGPGGYPAFTNQLNTPTEPTAALNLE